MVVAEEKIGVLDFLLPDGGVGAVLVKVLVDIAGMEFRTFHLEKSGVLGGDLIFDGGGKVGVVEIVVRTEARIGVIIGIEGIREVVHRAVLGGILQPRAPAPIRAVRTDANAVGLKHSGVFLLGNGLGKDAGADGGEDVGQQQLVLPGGLVAEVASPGVEQPVVTVGEEQMGGVIGVIVLHGLGPLAARHVGKAGVLVDQGEVGAAHGLVLVEKEFRAEEGAVGVQVLGMLQIGDGLVDGIALVVQQGGIEPGGGIVGVELHGLGEFLGGQLGIPGILERLVHAPGFAQVTAQKSAGRFQRRRRFQIFPAAVHVGGFDFGQTAAEPAVGEGTVRGD